MLLLVIILAETAAYIDINNETVVIYDLQDTH